MLINALILSVHHLPRNIFIFLEEEAVIFKLIIALLTTNLLLTLPEYVLAQNRLNLSLIVGEWSEKGKFNSSRYVFTQDGYYQLVFREKGKWRIFFNGTYKRISSNSLAITHEQLLDTFQISSLTAKSLSGKWFISIGDDEMINVSWQRCSVRR